MKYIKTFENSYVPIIMYWNNGKKRSEKYYFGVKRHRENGPAIQRWTEDGKKESEKYYIKGKLHREDGPAFIYWDKNKKTKTIIYYLDGVDYSREEYVEKLKEMNSPHYDSELMKYNSEKYNI